MITPKHREFIEDFQGECKGKYHIAYLAIIRIVGGNELREEAQEKCGRSLYKPDEMYPTREAAQMIIHAVDRDVPAQRMGKMVPRTYARAQPELFKDLTADKALEVLVLGYSEETDYGTTLKVLEQGPGRALMERKNNPMPCEFFEGVIMGMFELAGVPAEVKELTCQWKDEAPCCVFEITW